MLGAVAQAADDAHQPLWPQRDGSAGEELPHEEHGSLPLQVGPRRERGYDEEGIDQLVMRAARRLAIATAFLVPACVSQPSTPGTVPAPAPSAGAVTGPTATSEAAAVRWADSMLATMSVAEKAGQMVWPTLLGDFVATDAPQWDRLRKWIDGDKVGGFTVSVGSPTEIAAKLN